MASRRSSTITSAEPAAVPEKKAAAKARAPHVYSAQALATFCEVDLKTIHHWAERAKIPHFRTEGRHLRFYRNEVVRFLRAHGYPLPEALMRARPTVALALAPAMVHGASLSLEEVAKRLGSRFSVRRHPSSVTALTHLVASAPDVLVLALDDPAFSCLKVIHAIKEDPATRFVFIAALGADEALAEARASGAEVALPTRDAAKLPGELARGLAVT